MDRWDKLSMRERADLIRIYVKGGFLDLANIRGHYNHLAEGGPTERDDDTTLEEVAETTDVYDLPIIRQMYNPPAYMKNYVETKLAQKKKAAVHDAREKLKQLENNKNLKSGGYDKDTDRWYEHSSVEGGANTIGSGFKLNKPNDPVQKLVESRRNDSRGYITDQENDQLVLDRTVSDFYDEARRIYDKRYEEEAFDKLSPKAQSILTEFHYNGSLRPFRKFTDAIHNNDVEGMKSHYKRYTKGRPLKQRNEYVGREIDSLANGFYTIYEDTPQFILNE